MPNSIAYCKTYSYSTEEGVVTAACGEVFGEAAEAVWGGEEAVE